MNRIKYGKIILIVTLVLLFGLQVQADDKELFMGVNIGTDTVRPNVVILMDSSGSMNTAIFYPKKGLDGLSGTADDGYDLNISYTGSFENYAQVDELSQTQWFGRWIQSGNAYQYDTGELGTNWTGCYAGDGTPNNFQVGTNSQNFSVGETIMFRDTASPYYDALATIAGKYVIDGNPWFRLNIIRGGPITVNGGHFQRCPTGINRTPVVVRLYGIQDHGYNVRYPENYMKWLYIHATTDMQNAVSHYFQWGTFDVTKTPAEELSNCATPGNDELGKSGARLKTIFTRIQTAREVVCRVATNSNRIVNLGLFKFTYDNGGELVEHLTDMSDESSELVAYKNNVWDIAASTWTPLAETLADIWYYYKPGPASKTYWPVDYEIEYGTVNHSVSNPVGPIEYWCQNNYVVIMTDGESTMDRFDSLTKYGNSIFKQRPVRRTEPWEDWSDGWGDTDTNDNPYIPNPYYTSSTYCPNRTCWDTGNGSDLLDDVAYLMNHQDMYPDDFFGTDPVSGWPGNQNIYTYTIGFNADNHMLLQTAVNGDGAYYTATNYDELVDAFQLVITSINLRNFAFSSITAPKKTATATNEELTVSYVGYFMPSQAAPIWEGHLLSFRLIDLWGFDTSDPEDGMTPEEYVYPSEEACINASNGRECFRWLTLPVGHEWDAADHIPSPRNLYTHNNSNTLIEFVTGNRDILRPLFGATTTDAEAELIIEKIRKPQLGDIFHSDVGFVGPPPYGKQFITNIDPTGTGDEKYADYYETNKDRKRVIYAGTNDGIMHMFSADGADPGTEQWGFIPDAILPSLRTIAIDNTHTYTVDGRLSANDIYFMKEGDTRNTWSTLLVYGLRRGGKSFFGMDITEVSNQPKPLWEFTDTYSGQSWGKATIGRIKVQDPLDSTKPLERWVAIFPGGFAFNSENPNNREGKSIYVVDATNGQLIWSIAYHSLNGASDSVNYPDPEIVETITSDNLHYLTQSEVFNFSIPSSMTVIDKDGNGFLDTIYFGNVGGHLFKADISNIDTNNWSTYLIYKTDITTKAQTTISAIDAVEKNKLTVVSKVFEVGDTIMGKTSYAVGYITAIDNKILTVAINYGTFLLNETVVKRTYDPIYLSPAIAYDTCYDLWVFFGTGDRDRPRTNYESGRFIAINDNGVTNLTKSDLVQLTWNVSGDQLSKAELSGSNGWYFDFFESSEKIFDPEPIVLPDESLIPHIYFNTYQPPGASALSSDNPCSAPSEGLMTIYDLYLSTCGNVITVEGDRATGRIAGGGIYAGKEYVMYKSESGDVADVPGEEGGNFIADPKRLPYPGGVVFWKEKKR